MLDEIELKKYIDALLSKSEEAYLMSIEIINKPTINYRTEGFCFFICNAWELLLKAFIINKAKDINAINYRDDSNRTIGLDECVEKIFTSTTDKVKNNISFIRNIRCEGQTAQTAMINNYERIGIRFSFFATLYKN